MADDAIQKRADYMRSKLGHTMDTLLLGMLIAAFNLTPGVEADLSPEHLRKIDNTGPDGNPTHEGHLKYLMERFGASDLIQAQRFSDIIEEKLTEMYEKLARAEQQSGVLTQDSGIFMALMDTIRHEGEKFRKGVRSRAEEN